MSKKHITPKRKSMTSGQGCVEDPVEITKPMPTKWTIITALDWVLENACDSQLSEVFWKENEKPLKYLTRRLKLNKIQVVFLAILVERAEPLSWRKFGRFLDCSRMSMMTYTDDLDDLVAKRWVVRRGSQECGVTYEGFDLAQGVVSALRKNKVFVPEKIEDLSEQQFMDRIEGRLSRDLHDRNVAFADTEEWLVMMCKANPNLPVCKRLLRYRDIHVLSLMLAIIFDHLQWAGNDQEGVSMNSLSIFPDDYECDGMRFNLTHGEHVLMRDGYLEWACEDGVVNNSKFRITSKAKSEFLSSTTPSRSMVPMGSNNNRLLTSHTSITPKTLYYNASEQKQVERIMSMLSEDNLPAIQKRLQEQGMRKGVACLFYGGPGTGKTETVLQLARATGRDVMQVEIAGLRDKFVGESEKNIKEVFASYRNLCKTAPVMPILFFNEADAIINKRSANASQSVDKMNNAMQNIILQELETLDGILIATTNLTANMDSAFERRFLFKVEFNKPETDVKAKIWSSMLKNISDSDAYELASKYDFSGGQIENIARKRAIDYVLTGEFAGLKDIESMCDSELIDSRQAVHRQHVGFAV